MASTNKAREIMASLDEPDEVPSVVDPTADDHPTDTGTDTGTGTGSTLFTMLRDKLGGGKPDGSQSSGLDWTIPTEGDRHYFYGEDPNKKKTTTNRSRPTTKTLQNRTRSL